MTYLVSYTKDQDIQYHVFTEVPEPLLFILDDLHCAFTKKGYTWGSVPFTEELAEKCMFTMSKYEEGESWKSQTKN